MNDASDQQNDDLDTTPEAGLASHEAAGREPRPARPGGLRGLHAHRLGRARARPPAHPITPWAQARRERLIEQFPGERLVIPAGGFKVRANDTDYRFRAETAHTYLCGNQTSDAVLVIEDGEAVLYARPRSSRDTDEFFRDRQYGELWVGRRPSPEEISASLGIETRHLDDLPERLTGTAKTRVLRGADPRVDALVTGRRRTGRGSSPGCCPKRGWSRTSGRSGSSRRACDITDPRLRGLRARVGRRARAR